MKSECYSIAREKIQFDILFEDASSAISNLIARIETCLTIFNTFGDVGTNILPKITRNN